MKMRVLVVDEDKDFLQNSKNWLVEYGMLVDTESDFSDAAVRLQSTLYDIVYLGTGSDFTSISALSAMVRSAYKYCLVYLIAVNFEDEYSPRMMELETGVDYVILKQPEKNELLSLCQNAVRDLNQRRGIYFDTLTSLYNRYYFNDQLQREQLNFERYHIDCSLAVLRIDHYELAVFQVGQFLGEQILVQYAEELKNILRKSDYAGHWMGDEFAILLPSTSLEAAVQVAEKVQSCCQAVEVNFEGEIGISLGVASFQKNGLQLLSAANQALSIAKEKGLNQIAIPTVSS